jgi:hypothetical protein
VPHNKDRRLRTTKDLKRKRGVRPPYDRVLIVCEGKKTEPQYFEEIRKINRVPPVHVRVLHSDFGTEPRQIVDYAEAIFAEKKEYERVYVVFDRDEHRTYHDALNRANQLNGKLKNDEKKNVAFLPIPSVPCFEFWLLLHFDDVQAYFHRNEIFAQLKRHLHNYEKGLDGVYAATQDRLPTASQRASKLRQRYSPHTGTDPYTGVDELVEKLKSIVVKK